MTQQPTSSKEESKQASASLHEDLEGRKQRVAELEAEYNSLKEVTDVIDRDVSQATKEGKYLSTITLIVKEVEKKRDEARSGGADLDRKLAEAEDRLRRMLIE